ncbi:hypothetical protein Pmar_PMAR020296, partial [Perkinsus marinus ATCC 50983]
MTDHTVEVYDDYSKKWSRVPPMRSKRVGAAAMVVGDHLYVVGGYRVHPDQPLGCVEVYDPWLNRWKRLKSSMCIPRFGHSLALVDDRYLYAIGGDSQRQLVSEVEVFDTQIGRWLQQSELKICLPRPLAGGRVIEKDGLLYIVGGDVGSSPLQFSDLIYVLDTTVTPHVWSVLSTRLKVGRSACAVTWLDESKSAIGVFGGYVVIDGDFKEVATSEVITLEGTHVVPLHEAPILGRVMPVDAHAKEIPEMPSTRAGCRAVTVGCRVILVGGENPIPANAAEITESGSDSVSSPGSDRSTESSDILAEFVNNSNSAAADRSSIFAPLEGISDDPILDAPSTPSRSQDSPTRPASIDEAVTRAMQRYFTLVHSTRPNSDSGTQRERDAAAQLLQEITRALRVQAVHARRLSEPVRVVHDKPLVFDSSKWCWVDEQALFAGRTAAAISVGSVFPVSYGCESRRNSSGLRHSCKRSRVECTPSASARRRGKTGCSLWGCHHFEVSCELNMTSKRVDNGQVAAPIPLGMPVIEECPLMTGVRLSGSEVVHVIVNPGTRLPVDNKLLKLTTSRDHQSVATVRLVVSGGRTALSACRDFMSLTRELDTSTNHYQGLVQLDLYLSISVFGEVTAVLDELTDFRGINNGIAQAAGDGGSISDLPYQPCLIGTASCCYGRSRQESVSSSFTSISTDKTGCAVWECGIILAYCLCQAFLLRGKSSALKLPIGPDTENYGVELGCGTGLVSLALASLGAKMVATDGNDQVRALLGEKEAVQSVIHVRDDLVREAVNPSLRNCRELSWVPELDVLPIEYFVSNDERRPPEQLLPVRKIDIPNGPSLRLKQSLTWSSFAGPRGDHTGRGLWDASIILSRYVWRTNYLNHTKGRPILDLGCGTGLLTLTAAKWCMQRGYVSELQPRIIGIDCNEETVALARENAVVNGLSNMLGDGSVEFITLDWSNREELDALIRDTGTPGVILGSDIVYPGPESPIEPLLGALSSLRDDNTSILLSFRERSHIVSELMNEARLLGWDISCLDRIDFETDVPVDLTSALPLDARDFRLLTLSNHSKRPPSEAQRVEKLISSTLEGVGSVMNETLLVGKILAQAAGQEANAAVHDATDSIQKRFEEYLSSPRALEQLGEKRIELIREQVKASRELLETAAVFLRSTSESSLESSIEVLNKSLTLMEVPIAILGPQAKRDREAWSQSDPRKLIQFIRHISQQRQERLSEYVDALLASGQLTKHPLVPHEFEKKLYLDILSIVTFAFENAMGSLDNMQLWGHAIKVRSVQESDVFINLKLSGTSIHGREQLSVIVDSMLRDEFVNNPLIPDAVERSLYLNTVILIFRILEDLSNSLHVSVMGHRLEWKLIPLEIAEVYCQKAPSHIKLNEEVIDRLVKELLSDASINVFWIPDIIESAIYRNVLRLMLRVVEELLGSDYYKSLAQVPTKELQERLYELQNEHEMIGK